MSKNKGPWRDSQGQVWNEKPDPSEVETTHRMKAKKSTGKALKAKKKMEHPYTKDIKTSKKSSGKEEKSTASVGAQLSGGAKTTPKKKKYFKKGGQAGNKAKTSGYMGEEHGG